MVLIEKFEMNTLDRFFDGLKIQEMEEMDFLLPLYRKAK